MRRACTGIMAARPIGCEAGGTRPFGLKFRRPVAGAGNEAGTHGLAPVPVLERLRVQLIGVSSAALVAPRISVFPRGAERICLEKSRVTCVSGAGAGTLEIEMIGIFSARRCFPRGDGADRSREPAHDPVPVSCPHHSRFLRKLPPRLCGATMRRVMPAPQPCPMVNPEHGIRSSASARRHQWIVSS